DFQSPANEHPQKLMLCGTAAPAVAYWFCPLQAWELSRPALLSTPVKSGRLGVNRLFAARSISVKTLYVESVTREPGRHKPVRCSYTDREQQQLLRDGEGRGKGGYRCAALKQRGAIHVFAAARGAAEELRELLFSHCEMFYGAGRVFGSGVARKLHFRPMSLRSSYSETYDSLGGGSDEDYTPDASWFEAGVHGFRFSVSPFMKTIFSTYSNRGQRKQSAGPVAGAATPCSRVACYPAKRQLFPLAYAFVYCVRRLRSSGVGQKKQ
ncbi:hypothetical protein BaRGS_00013741, partial [Batillaria attramentaria]